MKKKVNDADFLCMDCKVNTFNVVDLTKFQYYMLDDNVWKAANPKIRGMLCLACVEARLQRRLLPGDFKITPENMLLRFLNLGHGHNNL